MILKIDYVYLIPYTVVTVLMREYTVGDWLFYFFLVLVLVYFCTTLWLYHNTCIWYTVEIDKCLFFFDFWCEEIGQMLESKMKFVFTITKIK